jgi:predicted Zn-dependent protease
MAENDVVFQEAVEALKEGKKAQARELLTGLLKSNQNNATYWVWLSAAMDTSKERIYCLQTAFKLDPDNAAA